MGTNPRAQSTRHDEPSPTTDRTQQAPAQRFGTHGAALAVVRFVISSSRSGELRGFDSFGTDTRASVGRIDPVRSTRARHDFRTVQSRLGVPRGNFRGSCRRASAAISRQVLKVVGAERISSGESCDAAKTSRAMTLAEPHLTEPLSDQFPRSGRSRRGRVVEGAARVSRLRGGCWAAAGRWAGRRLPSEDVESPEQADDHWSKTDKQEGR